MNRSSSDQPQNQQTQSDCGGCLNLFLFGLSITYLVMALMYELGKYDKTGCQDALIYTYEIGGLFTAMCVRTFLKESTSHKWIFKRVFLSDLFTVDELFSIICAFYSLYLAIIGFSIQFNSCTHLQTIDKTFIYAFWSVVSIAVIIAIYLFITFIRTSQPSHDNQQQQQQQQQQQEQLQSEQPLHSNQALLLQHDHHEQQQPQQQQVINF